MNIDRIVKNEKKLDNVKDSIKKLEKAMDDFKSNIKEIELLNKYYGSKAWFKDKEDYEKNRISQIKAGVLSEDAVWILNENIKEIIEEMKEFVYNYECLKK